MTSFTRQAYNAATSTLTGSHKDHFLRNILDCRSADVCDTGSTGSAERNRRRSNVPWCPWPTYADLAQWAHAEGVEAAQGRDETSNSDAFEWSLMAAIDDISEDTGLPYFVVDDDWEIVLDENGRKQIADVPPKVFEATLIHGLKLYRRRNSPDGVLGSSAFGGLARVAKYDPHVRSLLGNWLRKGVA